MVMVALHWLLEVCSENFKLILFCRLIDTENEMLFGFMALYNYYGPLAPGLNFVKNSLTYFYSLFISSSALHLIAERLASVAAVTSFKVFGLTRLRIECIGMN